MNRSSSAVGAVVVQDQPGDGVEPTDRSRDQPREGVMIASLRPDDESSIHRLTLLRRGDHRARQFSPISGRSGSIFARRRRRAPKPPRAIDRRRARIRRR